MPLRCRCHVCACAMPCHVVCDALSMILQGLTGILAIGAVRSRSESGVAILLPCWRHVFAMSLVVGGCAMCLPCMLQRLLTCLLPCRCQAFAMSAPCLSHVGAMLLPCLCDAVAMLLQWCCHAFPCVCHPVAMPLPCFCKAVAMPLPRHALPCLCHDA